MKILVDTMGSAGDVHPFVAVGQALAARGHDVALFANEHFRAVVESAGVGFRPTGTVAEYDELTGDPRLWHPTKGPIYVLSNVVEHLLPRTVDALLAEDPGDDTVIVSSTLGFAGRCAADAARVPLVRAHLQPTAFQSVHRSPRLPGLWMPDGAPRWWKRLLYRVSDAIVDRIVCPRLNAVRGRLGLPPARRVFHDWIHEASSLAALYPEWYHPPQPDAPAGLQHTGFVRFDAGLTRRPGDGLARWLAGDAPVLFTHGSANRHGRAFFEACVAAARAAGRRALLVTSEPRDVAGLTGDDVHHETYVPFGEVLGRCAAFVHHGGVGTVAQGLAAGVPQLVVPLGFDQLDNAARVVQLGVGRTVRARRWSAHSATSALRTLLDAPDVPHSCTELQQRVSDDGDAAACAAVLVEESATRPRSPGAT